MSKSDHPVVLPDDNFSVNDGLVKGETRSTAVCSVPCVGGAPLPDLVPPESISRLLIERGDYPAVPICFRHPLRASPGWSEWLKFEVDHDSSENALANAGLLHALFISSRCDFFKDDICLRHVVRRWSSVTHTFVCSWGEFTPTLEDVYNIMRIPITGDIDPFMLALSSDEEKRHQILLQGTLSAKGAGNFRFCSWVKYFWGSTKNGKFEHGQGFRSKCRLAAMLAYWLSKFIFSEFPYRDVQKRLLPMAIVLARGARLPLAPLFLGHFYTLLDTISLDEKEGAGGYYIDSLVSTSFLQVFIWERFKGLMTEPSTRESQKEINFPIGGYPLCCRWWRRKVVKGMFNPLFLDEVDRFVFRPYLKGDHGFEVYPFFYPEADEFTHPDLHSQYLATISRPIPTYDENWKPILVRYSPNRVKRQFGIDQNILGPFIDGSVSEVIASFTQHDDALVLPHPITNLLGKKARVGICTSSFEELWVLQQQEFRNFVKVGARKLLSTKNKRLLCSGLVSKSNLVYASGEERVAPGGRNVDIPPLKKGTKRRQVIEPELNVPGVRRRVSSNSLEPCCGAGLRRSPPVASIGLPNHTPSTNVNSSFSGMNNDDPDGDCNSANPSASVPQDESREDEFYGQDNNGSKNCAPSDDHLVGADLSDTNMDTRTNCGERTNCTEIENVESVFLGKGTVRHVLEEESHCREVGVVHDILKETSDCREDGDGDGGVRDKHVDAVGRVEIDLQMAINPSMQGVDESSREMGVGFDSISMSLENTRQVPETGSTSAWEMRLANFMTRFDSIELSSSNTDISHIAPQLSGETLYFRNWKVPSEYVDPLTRFADRYAGDFSSLFSEELGDFHKLRLVKDLGLLLHSMSYEEVKDEEVFLVWRDACHGLIKWGLRISFILTLLRKAARHFFGYMLRPAGLEDCRTKILLLEETALELRNKLSTVDLELAQATKELHSKLSVDVSDDSFQCMFNSKWTDHDRVIHYLF